MNRNLRLCLGVLFLGLAALTMPLAAGPACCSAQDSTGQEDRTLTELVTETRLGFAFGDTIDLVLASIPKELKPKVVEPKAQEEVLQIQYHAGRENELSKQIILMFNSDRRLAGVSVMFSGSEEQLKAKSKELERSVEGRFGKPARKWKRVEEVTKFEFTGWKTDHYNVTVARVKLGNLLVWCSTMTQDSRYVQ